MKIAVISYSLTGNNDALAACIAKELSAEQIKISTRKSMNNGAIMLDMLFGRTPRSQPGPEIMDKFDLILFFGPIWMGQVASPLRAYLQYLKKSPKRYGFLSISGGADGDNPKLRGELLKRAGAAPVLLLDQHIADLLPTDQKPERKDTSAYTITPAEAERLANKAVEVIRNTF